MKTGRKPTYARATLMDAALTVARRDGYTHMSRLAISQAAQCSPTLLNRYFGTMTQLRRAVMREAVVRGDLAVIAQGLAAGDKNAHHAGDAVKREALGALLV